MDSIFAYSFAFQIVSSSMCFRCFLRFQHDHHDDGDGLAATVLGLPSRETGREKACLEMSKAKVKPSDPKREAEYEQVIRLESISCTEQCPRQFEMSLCLDHCCCHHRIGSRS